MTQSERDEMISVEQCREYAASCKELGIDPNNSARRSTALTGISRSWVALAHQLENLAMIEKSEAVAGQPSPV